MYIVDADDFCESNNQIDVLRRIKEEVPEFKISLFTIPGLSSFQFIGSLYNTDRDWMEFIPHGWMHPTSRECENWDYQTCKRYVREMKENFVYQRGFKAPGWQIPDTMYQVLKEEGYWVADQEYNTERRPNCLSAYLLDSPYKLHYHIGHMGGHNANEIGMFEDYLKSLKGEKFEFISDYMKGYGV